MLGNLWHRHATEKLQYDHVRMPLALLSKSLQGVIQGDEVDLTSLLHNVNDRIQRCPTPFPAAPLRPAGAGMIDEHPSHRAGHRTEKIRPPAIGWWGRSFQQATDRLMNQCRRLQRMVWSFAMHQSGGNRPQLVVGDLVQPLPGRFVPSGHLVEQLGDFAGMLHDVPRSPDKDLAVQ